MYCDSSATAGEKDVDVIEEEEESLRQLTLDEWKSLQQDQRPTTTTSFNIRKPGEGCKSDPSWNKMEVLRKKQLVDGHTDSTGQFDDAVSM